MVACGLKKKRDKSVDDGDDGDAAGSGDADTGGVDLGDDVAGNGDDDCGGAAADRGEANRPPSSRDRHASSQYHNHNSSSACEHVVQESSSYDSGAAASTYDSGPVNND